MDQKQQQCPNIILVCTYYANIFYYAPIITFLGFLIARYLSKTQCLSCVERNVQIIILGISLVLSAKLVVTLIIIIANVTH